MMDNTRDGRLTEDTVMTNSRKILQTQFWRIVSTVDELHGANFMFGFETIVVRRHFGKYC